jgi:hypothetical protein
MSIQSVGQDIYGFLDLLSKRQGPNDNTNPTPTPMPGTPSPMPFASPQPQPQTPPVQVAQAGPPVATDASPAPAPAPPTLPTSGPPPTGFTPSGGTDFNVPQFPDPGGGIPIYEILAEQKRRQAKQAMLDQIVQSGMLIAGGLSRDPATRRGLYSAAGGIDTSGRGGGAGLDFTVDQLSKLDADSRAQAAETQWRTKLGPLIASRFKVDPVALATMNPKDRSEFVKGLASGDKMERIDGKDGSVAFLNMRTGERYLVRASDEFLQSAELRARQEEIRKQALHPLELEAKAAGTAKDIQTTNDLKEAAAQRELTRADIPAIAKITGKSEIALEAMGAPELQKFVADELKTKEPTALVKDFLFENDRRREVGVAPFQTLTEYQAYLSELKRKEAAATGAEAEVTKITLPIARDVTQSNNQIFSTDVARQDLLRQLKTGRVITGSKFAAPYAEIRRTLSTAGRTIDADVATTEIFQNDALVAANDMLNQAKGSQSNFDAERALRLSGADLKGTAEGTRAALTLNRWQARQQMVNNNSRLLEMHDASPTTKIFKAPQPITIDEDMMRYMSNTELQKMMADPEFRRGDFARTRGGDAAEFLEKNMSKVIAEKMQLQGKKPSAFREGEEDPGNVYNVLDKRVYEDAQKMSTEQFLARRARFEEEFKQYGLSGEGLFDLIATAKKAGHFGEK